MLRNYLTVGFRALAKHPTYTLINVLGLAIGMAACLMILLFVRYELSYDKWLPDAANTYQLQSWYVSHETGEVNKLQMTPYAAGKALAKDFPQVEREVYAFSTSPVLMRGGEASKIEDFVFADGNLLEVLRLPMVRGTAAALAQAGNVVLTRTEAIRLFGSDDVVGKTLSVISRGKTRDLRIAGVLADLPRASHFKASAIARVDYVAWNSDTPDVLDCWGCQNGWVWLTLKPGTDPKAIEAQFPAWEKRNIPDENTGEARFNAGDDQDWRLIRVDAIHLGEAHEGAMTPGNDRRTIATFGIIALLILGMAAINYTNLATARASQRAREVALRRVLGATRRQLIVQFLGESIVVAVIAMVIALAIVELLMPGFAAFLEADIPVRYFGRDGIALPVLLLVVTVGVAGGVYPAFVISRFQPAAVLKANKSSAETPGTGRLRSALVVGQFAISIGLIVCTAVVYAQTVFARSADPGFNRSHILQVEEMSRYQMIGKGETMAERVKRVPGVESVGRTAIGVGAINNSTTGVMKPGATEPISIDQYQVDRGFLATTGMRMVAGRWFDDRPMDDMTVPYPPDLAAETAMAQRGANVVINELAAKRLGNANPADAVGKTYRAGLFQNEAGLVPITVIGVVKDARFRSVREPLDPIIFQNTRDGLHTEMLVRFHGDPAAVRAGVERAWKSVVTDVPFTAKFSEDIIAELYKAEDARAKTFAAFALLAVIVACLGLYGLAAFTAERRTKEIGIRKVLGARTRDIVRLLVWQFTRPIIVANLIAWPVAWWLMRDWLNGFDQRIALSPAYFLSAGLIALAIAAITIMGHAIRVARKSPVFALRYE